ncbi:DNA-binding transcriptional LysR family regulator [Sinobacterium caligoides]|uniref:DNA-binding transcriptional LysR family regulator n=1 Tax=Sinobacterium caligoides TaxID=933926 RepID=A0A3N2DP96_9GAMM|nr:LysR family transcriptional regulator [Sinobacterium caligoides]ROS01623.1 DNA-binding transcriptional LysR family regulator [Sinobacterium caligoides]
MTSLDDLNLFALTVRHQGISAAAAATNMQRSKISRRLQALEHALGYQLLIRTTRHIELTEQGRWLYRQIESPLNTLQAATELMVERGTAPKGLMRIAIPPTLGVTEFFADTIERYISLYPQVQLEIEHEKSAIDLRRSNTDLQLLPGFIDSLHDDYVQQSLIQFPYTLVASPCYLSKKGRPKALAELADYDFLASRYTRSLMPECRNYRLFSDDLRLLHQLAKAGQGIAILPTSMIEEDLASGALSNIDCADQLTPPSISLIYPAQAYLPERTRLMVKMLRDNFAL